MPDYTLRDPDTVFTPGLLFYKSMIQDNIKRLIARVGSPQRLRPHIKTHKTREIVRLELAAGITKQKAATIAEAELLAQCEVSDVLLAYPIVGPNTRRLAALAQKYPATRFATVADHPDPLAQLSAAMTAAGQSVDVLIDLDVGQHRTGIAARQAASLYQQLANHPGLRPGGLHVYDGHNHQPALAERQAAVQDLLGPVLELRDSLVRAGLPVPRLVLGGTPTFPVFASLDIAGAECSPGTCILNDANYGGWFEDLAEFVPAALLLTRVISRPSANRVTFDLGTKSVASDPPAGKRCILLDVPEARAVLHNEEHLVIETPAAERYRHGDVAYAVPAHICPTCALHQFASVIENGQVVERWEIAARDRVLTV